MGLFKMTFFSGHNMANEIMRKTSLPMQMREYQRDYNAGRVRTEEYHPDRLNTDYETTKPFLPIPEPTLVVHGVGIVKESPSCDDSMILIDAMNKLRDIREERAYNLRSLESAERDRERKALSEIGIYL